MRVRHACLLLGLLVACSAGPAAPAPVLRVYTTPELAAAITEQASLLPVAPVGVEIAMDPLDAARHAAPGAPRIAVDATATCSECANVSVDGGIGAVHGSSLLSAQYGLARLCEEMGFRTFHPWRRHAPATLALPADGFAVIDGPGAQSLRGIQVHTLHPIEAYYALWEPSDAGFDAARHELDWLVVNRGNFFLWAALGHTGDLEAWRAHTKRVIDYAHLRGVRVGIGVQLGGASNLQGALALTDGTAVPDLEASMREHLAPLVGLGFDHVSLAFGEFSGTPPDAFIAEVDMASRAIAAVLPDATQSAVVHVGNSPELQVTYMGMTMLQYFLVQYADARLVPWVHTVMYYDLFEDAGGAYLHDDFGAHRRFLLDRLHAGLPVVYNPETAYWIDFDDSVPTYLPVYARSRWLDLSRVAAQATAEGSGPLTGQVIFSSGWEWGYWQNDVATLRDSYALPARWEEPYEWMFAPWGADGVRLAAGIAQLGEAQHHALIEQRLAPWLAGRDTLLDAGATGGIVSQPVRPDFATIAAFDDAERAAFDANVVAPLGVLLDATTAVQRDLASLPNDDPFFAETRDGIEVDRARTAFVHALLQEVQASATGADTAPYRDAADAAYADGMTAVARRHGALLDPDGARLTGSGSNATIYPHGYLRYADDLCYWTRERAQVRRVVDGTADRIPPCFP